MRLLRVLTKNMYLCSVDSDSANDDLPAYSPAQSREENAAFVYK